MVPLRNPELSSRVAVAACESAAIGGPAPGTIGGSTAGLIAKQGAEIASMPIMSRLRFIIHLSLNLPPGFTPLCAEPGRLTDHVHVSGRSIDIFVLERRLARNNRRTQESCRRGNAGGLATAGVFSRTLEGEK